MGVEKENKSGKSLLKQFLPISLITLFSLVVIYFLVSYSKIENIIDRIRKNGGAVQSRSVFPDWVQRSSPQWAVKKFQKPYAVWLPPEFGDKELQELLEIEGLTSLTATGTKVSEDSFLRLIEYKGLQLLYLSRNNFSLEKLKWLEKQMPATTVIY